MMMTMKKFLMTLLLVAAGLCASAQPNGQKGQPLFDPQKFQQMVEESLTKAAGLTADEAKAFFPLYNDMRERQRKMGVQIYELKKNAKGDAKSCTEAIQKINQLKVEMAEVERDTYKRILKVVPAEKVFKVMKAEDDFHRRMVQGPRNRRPQGQQGQQGQRRHNGDHRQQRER